MVHSRGKLSIGFPKVYPMIIDCQSTSSKGRRVKIFNWMPAAVVVIDFGEPWMSPFPVIIFQSIIFAVNSCDQQIRL